MPEPVVERPAEETIGRGGSSTHGTIESTKADAVKPNLTESHAASSETASHGANGLNLKTYLGLGLAGSLLGSTLLTGGRVPGVSDVGEGVGNAVSDVGRGAGNAIDNVSNAAANAATAASNSAQALSQAVADYMPLVIGGIALYAAVSLMKK